MNCKKKRITILFIVHETECITSMRVLPCNMIKFIKNKGFLFAIFEKNIKKKILYKKVSPKYY